VNRTILRRARKAHYCSSCYAWSSLTSIKPGDLYLEFVYSPRHEDMENERWWRGRECQDCAKDVRRGHLFPARTVTRDSDNALFEVLGAAPWEHEKDTPTMVYLRPVDGWSYVKVSPASFVCDFTANPAPPVPTDREKAHP
jgi:hypothetical protein